MTEERLDEISQRWEAATKGTWTIQEYGPGALITDTDIFKHYGTEKTVAVVTDRKWEPTAGGPDDLAFAACAHQAIPELLTEVRELRAENEVKLKHLLALDAELLLLRQRRDEMLNFLASVAEFAKSRLEVPSGL